MISRAKFAKSAARIEGAILIIAKHPFLKRIAGKSGWTRGGGGAAAKHPCQAVVIGYGKRQERIRRGAKQEPFPTPCPARAGGAPHDIDGRRVQPRRPSWEERGSVSAPVLFAGAPRKSIRPLPSRNPGTAAGLSPAVKILQKVARNTATFGGMQPIGVAGVTYRNFARSNKNAHRG